MGMVVVCSFEQVVVVYWPALSRELIWLGCFACT